MNPIIISTIIASASFIISIFAANWLNQRHVDKLMEIQNKRLDDLRHYLDARFALQEQNFNTRFTALEQTINARFDTVNARFDAVDDDLKELSQRVRRLEDILFKPARP